MFGEKCSKQGHGPYALSAFLGHTSKKSFKRKLISVLFETRQRLLTLSNHDNARNEIARSKKEIVFIAFGVNE